jgi:formylglycine-generating enzyme required for sulfatase activity
MTLVEIRRGVFVHHDESPKAIVQKAQVPRSFFLSDREVSVRQFQQFMNDRNYANAEKPVNWRSADGTISPTPDHPVQMVNWYDAVLFCNWLSHKEGRTAGYERTGTKEKYKIGNTEYENDAWRPVDDSTGYRLPTDAEWEYACRAGTTTEFASGSDEELLRKYAVFQASRTGSCGSKLPNGWGLFDMHGNVYEWCWDEINAMPPSGGSPGAAGVPYRVIRGGSWYGNADFTRSSSRSRNAPEFRDFYLGIRVARGQ